MERCIIYFLYKQRTKSRPHLSVDYSQVEVDWITTDTYTEQYNLDGRQDKLEQQKPKQIEKKI